MLAGKRLIIPLFCLLSMTVVPGHAQVRIMPFGNSITYDDPGDVRDSAFRAGYRRYLWYMLDSAGYNVDFVGRRQAGYGYSPAIDPDNEGWPGINDQWASQNIYQALAANKADIVLFHVGTNNVSFRTSSVYIAQALSEVDRYELDSSRQVIVVLALILNRNPYHTNTSIFNENVRTLAASRIANGDKIIVVDMENGAGFEYSLEDMATATHPNDVGYYKMARNWFSVLDTILPPPPPAGPAFLSSPSVRAVTGVPYSYQVAASGYPKPKFRLLEGEEFLTVDSLTGIVYGVVNTTGLVPVSIEAYNIYGTIQQNFSLRADPDFCPANLLAYWEFNDAGADTVISEIGNFEAIPIGVNNPVPGFREQGIDFDGNSYLHLVDSSIGGFSAQGSFTLSLWTKFTSVVGNNKVMAGKRIDSTSWWSVGALSGNGAASFQIVGPGGEGNHPDTLLSGPQINDGEWHNLVAVRNGTTGWNGLYVDGNLVDSITIIYSSLWTDSLTIGFGAFGDSAYPMLHFTGTLDEIAFYPTAVPPDEIATGYSKLRLGLHPCGAENPTITGQNGLLLMDEDNTCIIRRTDLIVEDANSNFPDDFTLHLLSGTDYSVTGNTVSPSADFFGILSIPVVVNDGSWASNLFYLQVEVAPVDDPPYLIAPVLDQLFQEDAPTRRISLADRFGDIDSPVDEIVTMVVSVSPSDRLAVQTINDSLYITPLANRYGRTQVVLGGQSGSFIVYDTVFIDVMPVDDTPLLAGIPDQTISEGGTFSVVQLSDYLTNVDSDTILWEIVHTGELMFSIANHQLVITIPDINWNGNDTLYLVAIDSTVNQFSDIDTIVFRVLAVDDAPFVAAPIPNIIVSEDAPDNFVTLSNHFSDIDNPISSASYSVNIQPAGIVSYSLRADTLVLHFLPDKNGAVIVSINCSVGGKSATDQFNILINSVNDAPAFSIEPTVSLLINFSPAVVIDLVKFPIPPDETSQIVQYSLSPASIGFANVSINPLTGRVNISAKPDMSGSQVFVVTANDQQSANNIARDTFVLTISTKLVQTITFNPISNKTILDPAFKILAISNAAVKVNIEVVSGPVTLVNDTIYILGLGQVTLRATAPETPDYFEAVPVDRTFTITKAYQTISFTPPDTIEFGSAPVLLSALAESGLPVTFSIVSGPGSIEGYKLTVNAPGVVRVRASQSGNDTYFAATPVDKFIIVTKRSQAISIIDPGAKRFGDSPFLLSASSTSSLPVELEIVSGPAVWLGNLVSITGVGSIIIKASQAGNEYYYPANTIYYGITVNKGLQDIQFELPAFRFVSDGPVELEAFATSGLTVEYSLEEGLAEIADGQLWFFNPDTIVVRAYQPGNGFWEEATPVERQLVVTIAEKDVAINAFIQPATLEGLPNNTEYYVEVEVQNYGQTSISGFRLAIQDNMDATPVVEEFVINLAAGMQGVFRFSLPWHNAGNESWLCVWLADNYDDNVPSNDTICLYRDVVSTEFKIAETIRVFPNPAHSWAKVQWADNKDVRWIKLINIDGKTAYFNHTIDRTNELILDLNGLPNGVYVIETGYADGVLTNTLIIK